MNGLARRRWWMRCAVSCVATSLGVVFHAAAAAERSARSVDTAVAAAAERLPGAQVLFSGKPEELRDHWVRRQSQEPAAWKVQDGALVAGGGDIATRQEFQDFLLHVEFKVPSMPNAHGQARGNSGIGLQGRYEVQVLDSYGIAEPGSGDCGAVYSQAAPLFNACKPPLEWQTYDISFRAPRFDSAGKVSENPRVTVFQNGILVQNNQEIKSLTGIQSRQIREMGAAGPIVLQDHGNPVQYRNVWVLPLPLHGALHY
jgi:hypothetical protein